MDIILAVIPNKKVAHRILNTLEHMNFKWSSGVRPTNYVPMSNGDGGVILILNLKKRNIQYDSRNFFNDGEIKEAYPGGNNTIVHVKPFNS